MADYLNINDAAEAHIGILVNEGFTDPGHSDEVASTLMAISDMYETQLTDAQKATLPPKPTDFNPVADVLYRLLLVMKLAGLADNVTVTPLTATENKTYTPETSHAYGPVTVNVPVPTLDSLSATENKTYTPTEGHAYNSVTVSVPVPTLSTFTVYSDTTAGDYDAPSGTAYNKVVVSSSPTPSP